MPSRRSHFVLVLSLAALSIPLHANSVPMNQGALTVSLNSGGFFDFSFSLKGPGFTATGISPDEFFGFPTCSRGCFLSDITGPNTELIRLTGPGAMFLNGQLTGWNSTPFSFGGTPTSVVLSPSGLLTITGIAHPFGPFNVCEPPGLDCLNTGLSLVPGDHGQWRFIAHFTPDVPPGLFDFKDLLIISTPEPGTMLLVGTGIGVIGALKRGRAFQRVTPPRPIRESTIEDVHPS